MSETTIHAEAETLAFKAFDALHQKKDLDDAQVKFESLKPELARVLADERLTQEEKRVLASLADLLRETLLSQRIKAAHLPAHVATPGAGPAGVSGIGGNLAFVAHAFLSKPLSDLSRQGLQSVQLELPFRDLTLGCEVFTEKYGKRAALTGLEENLFFTLFNDRFLGLGSGPGGRSIIEGDTRALAKIIGANAPRVGAINEAIRNLSRMEFSVPGRGHELHGRVFPVALCPDEAAASSDTKHLFKFEVSEWIPTALLKAQYERVDLPTFWSIGTPAARRLYACMKRLSRGYSPRIETLSKCIGLPYPDAPGKENRERRAKTKKILVKHLDEIQDATGGDILMAGRTWFDGKRVAWTVGGKQLQAATTPPPPRKTRRPPVDGEKELKRLWNSCPATAKTMINAYRGKVPMEKISALIRQYSKAT